MTDFDIIVIGAGAAGLAAGTRLARSPVSFAILEARGEPAAAPLPTAQAPIPSTTDAAGSIRPTATLARAGRSERLYDRHDASQLGKQACDLGFSPGDQAAFATASEQFNDRISKPPGRCRINRPRICSNQPIAGIH